MRSPSLERQLVRGLYEESQGKGYEYIVRDDVIIWNELKYSHNPAKKMRELERDVLLSICRQRVI